MQDERFVIAKKAVSVSVQNNARAILIEKDGCISLAGFRSLQLVVCLGNPFGAFNYHFVGPETIVYIPFHYHHIKCDFIARVFTRIDGESDMDLLKRLYFKDYPEGKPEMIATPKNDLDSLGKPAKMIAITKNGSNLFVRPTEISSIQDVLDEHVNNSIIDVIKVRCEKLVEEVAQDRAKGLVLGNTYCLTQVLDEKSLAIMQGEFGKVLNPEDIFIASNKLMLYLTKR